MYISHATDPEETVGSGKMPSFESGGFGSEVFVGWRELKWRKLDHFLRLWIFGFHDDH